MTADDTPKPPLSMAELIATLRAEGRLIDPSDRKGSAAIIGARMPPPDPPSSGDGPGKPETGPDEQKPLQAVLGRPMQRPGETKEEAARRLARELFGKLKPADDGAADSANDDTHGPQGTP